MSTNQPSPPPKEPWWNDRDMILKIILLLTMIVNLIQSAMNGDKASKVEKQTTTIQAHQEENSKKIEKIHKEVKTANAQMGIPVQKEE